MTLHLKAKPLNLSEIDADGKRAKLERSYLLLVAVSCGERLNYTRRVKNTRLRRNKSTAIHLASSRVIPKCNSSRHPNGPELKWADTHRNNLDERGSRYK